MIQGLCGVKAFWCIHVYGE